MTDILKKRKDIEREIDGEASRLQVVVTSKIYDEMDRLAVSKSELADKVGVPLDYLTNMLDGNFPITIKMMVRFSTALGFKWDLVILDESIAQPSKLKSTMKAH